MTEQEIKAATKALEEVGLQATFENIKKLEIIEDCRGIKGNKAYFIYISTPAGVNFSGIEIKTLKNYFED